MCTGAPRCVLVHGFTFSVLVLTCCCPQTASLHVAGSWSTQNGRFTVIAKFGFQQIDPFNKENSRGFVYGNVTALRATNNRAVLFIVPQALISSFFSDSMYEQSCDSMLQNISVLAFEAKCLVQGRGDVMRWIPCATNKLCAEEDDSSKVIDGYQMTLRVEEPYTAEYWYVVLVACSMNKDCKWTSSATDISVYYDIWLTNGSPLSQHFNPFSRQFSFDEQDSAEMYLMFLVMYTVVMLCEWRAVMLYRQPRIPPRHRLLCWIIGSKTLGLAFQSINVVVFAYDGEGLIAFRFLGETARLFATCLLCLLLILLGRGWSLEVSSDACSKAVLFVWSALSAAHFVLFFVNFFFVDDILHDIDVFKSWPGYGMLLIRIAQALWFLMEIRNTIDRQPTEEKAVFLAHVGAGFLVWFVYLSGLGIIASFISILWRFEFILVVTTISNFFAIACLVHLFWPTGANQHFFLSDSSSPRPIDSHEMEDFEHLLIEDKDDAQSDLQDSDNFHAV